MGGETMRLLFLTVGGTGELLEDSLKNHTPDRVVFICSDDKDGVKGTYTLVEEGIAYLPNNKTKKLSQPLKELAGVPSETLILKNCDNLVSTYNEIYETLQRYHNNYPDAECIVDYAGGTKTMSAGMVVAALEFKKCIFIPTLPTRRTSQKYEESGGFVQRIFVEHIHLHRFWHEVVHLAENFNFSFAYAFLQNLLRTYAPPTEEGEKWQRRIRRLKGLVAYDSFDFEEALKYFQGDDGVPKELKQTTARLREGINLWRECTEKASSLNMTDEAYEDWKAYIKKQKKRKQSFFALPWELLLNAQRRAKQGKYDDATARLYRALESLTQGFILFRYNIHCSYVAQTSKGREPNEPISLMRGLELIARDAEDLSLREFMQSALPKIKNILQKRNFSILAHGYHCITRDEYEREIFPLFNELIKTVFHKMDIPMHAPLEVSSWLWA